MLTVEIIKYIAYVGISAFVDVLTIEGVKYITDVKKALEDEGAVVFIVRDVLKD